MGRYWSLVAFVAASMTSHVSDMLSDTGASPVAGDMSKLFASSSPLTTT
jgi:hypothetical protein